MQIIQITRAAAIQSMANLGIPVSPGILTFTLADALIEEGGTDADERITGGGGIVTRDREAAIAEVCELSKKTLVAYLYILSSGYYYVSASHPGSFASAQYVATAEYGRVPRGTAP